MNAVLIVRLVCGGLAAAMLSFMIVRHRFHG